MNDMLPQVTECRATPQQCASLLDEIASSAKGIAAKMRTPQGDRAVQLSELADAITNIDSDIESSRPTISAQVRYTCHGSLWIDTLTIHDDHVHILRVAHDLSHSPHDATRSKEPR